MRKTFYAPIYLVQSFFHRIEIIISVTALNGNMIACAKFCADDIFDNRWGFGIVHEVNAVLKHGNTYFNFFSVKRSLVIVKKSTRNRSYSLCFDENLRKIALRKQIAVVLGENSYDVELIGLANLLLNAIKRSFIDYFRKSGLNLKELRLLIGSDNSIPSREKQAGRTLVRLVSFEYFNQCLSCHFLLLLSCKT